jgi:hypothetical protein
MTRHWVAVVGDGMQIRGVRPVGRGASPAVEGGQRGVDRRWMVRWVERQLDHGQSVGSEEVEVRHGQTVADTWRPCDGSRLRTILAFNLTQNYFVHEKAKFICCFSKSKQTVVDSKSPRK